MKKLVILLYLCCPILQAQDLKETIVEAPIKEVTVFLKGAQITRSGEYTLSAGRTSIRIKGLSPYIDEKSIQVKGEGEFTILSVHHSMNYLEETRKEVQRDSLSREIDKIQDELMIHSSRLEVLDQQKSLLNENKQRGDKGGMALEELKQTLEFYNLEWMEIKREERIIDSEISALTSLKNRIKNQLSETYSQDNTQIGEIIVRVDAKKPGKAVLKINYITGHAGWYPNYDIRVSNIEAPLELTYKADVFQSTGEEWKNVTLRLSNADPHKSSVAPELTPWYVGLKNINLLRGLHQNSSSFGQVSGVVLSEKNDPLPGVNVVVKGSSIGTVTDIHGRYSLTLPAYATHLVYSFVGMESLEAPIHGSNMDIKLQNDVMQLSEVSVDAQGMEGRVAGVATVRGISSIYGARSPRLEDLMNTQTVVNQTTVDFLVDRPYTIKSDGQKLSVDLKKHAMDASYEYYAIPKLEKDAYLIAKVTDWEHFHLMEGEVNLYFEDAYVGRSVLDARTLQDTLEISLGRDSNIILGRTKVDDYSKTRFVGLNTIDKRAFELLVRNKKQEEIKITLFDQIPVSVVGEISVEATELTKGKLDKTTGEVMWEMVIQPQESFTLMLAYEVKYPRNEQVALE